MISRQMKIDVSGIGELIDAAVVTARGHERRGAHHGGAGRRPRRRALRAAAPARGSIENAAAHLHGMLDELRVHS